MQTEGREAEERPGVWCTAALWEIWRQTEELAVNKRKFYQCGQEKSPIIDTSLQERKPLKYRRSIVREVGWTFFIKLIQLPDCSYNTNGLLVRLYTSDLLRFVLCPQQNYGLVTFKEEEECVAFWCRSKHRCIGLSLWALYLPHIIQDHLHFNPLLSYKMLLSFMNNVAKAGNSSPINICAVLMPLALHMSWTLCSLLCFLCFKRVFYRWFLMQLCNKYLLKIKRKVISLDKSKIQQLLNFFFFVDSCLHSAGERV